MEVTEALRIPLDPAHVRDALADLTLLRASLDNCESFTRTPNGEYGLTLVVPLGALRARYEIRVHEAGRTRQDAHAEAEEPTPADDAFYAKTLSFKARGEGVGSLRGQIAVALTADDDDGATWIEYTCGRPCPARLPACRRARSKTRCAKAQTISSPNSAKWCARSTACSRCARSRSGGTFFCAPARWPQ